MHRAQQLLRAQPKRPGVAATNTEQETKKDKVDSRARGQGREDRGDGDLRTY